MIIAELQAKKALAERWAEAEADKDKLEERREREREFATCYDNFIDLINKLFLRQQLLPLDLENIDTQILQNCRDLVKQGLSIYQRQQVGTKNQISSDLAKQNRKFSALIKEHAEKFRNASEVIDMQQALEATRTIAPGSVPAGIFMRLKKACDKDATPVELQDNLTAWQEAQKCLANSSLKDWQRQLLQRITMGKVTLFDLTPQEMSWLHDCGFAAKVKLRYEI